MRKSQGVGMVVRRDFKRSRPKSIGARFKKDSTNMRVALIGSPKHENRGEVKELIWNLKKKFGDELILITRGQSAGIERWVRKFALELGCKYIEYNSANTPMSLYSGMTKEYYGKPFHPTQPLHQYDCLVRGSDKIVHFGEIKQNEFNHFKRVLSRYSKTASFIS
jgi:hypothetical protein